MGVAGAEEDMSRTCHDTIPRWATGGGRTSGQRAPPAPQCQRDFILNEGRGESLP